jgi:hypothetical protein
MTATTRRYLDADSHVLEPNDWLLPYADPHVREKMRVLPNPLELFGSSLISAVPSPTGAER